MTTIELFPEGGSPRSPSSIAVEWPADGGRSGEYCHVSFDPWLTGFGRLDPTAIDLVRTAVAASIADQLVPRSSWRWSRDLTLLVHATEPASVEPAIELLELLLFFLSGDEWAIELVRDTTSSPRERATPDQASHVSLLSGGLDSLCGAVLAEEDTTFLGHYDNTAVQASQKHLRAQLTALRGEIDYQQISLGVTHGHQKERTTRTRSFLFMALGVALAAGRGASSVVVPENGFTSLNPPLAANRGGPNTTRSTHPTTFAYANAVLDALQLGIRYLNPYQWSTKGELVSRAAASAGRPWMKETIPLTLSCATLNINFYRGGNPNWGCGICVACMTRRGAIRAARIPDQTNYAIDLLPADSRAKLLRERGADLTDVRARTGWKPDLAFLCAMGPHVAGFDYDRGMRLLADGMKELTRGLPD